MRDRPYTLYRTRRVAPAARVAAIGSLVLLALGPVAVTALALGRADPVAATPKPSPRPPARQAPTASPGVTIAAVGDVALGHPGSPLDDPDAIFAHVRPLLRGDLVTANLETALSDRPAAKCGDGRDGCYTFRAAPATAKALRRAGFTLLNLANNHTRDAGDAGLVDTGKALAAAGLDDTGAPGQVTIAKARGVRIAVVGFAPYPWAADLLDVAGAQRLVRAAAARADLVVVQMHAGAEGTAYQHVSRGDETYLGERRGDPTAFAHAVIDAGADLVVGHGPHLLRALEWYRGRLIAYSLGNFASYRNFALDGPLGVSAVLRVRLHADGTWAGGTLVPVRLEGTGTPTPDARAAAVSLVRDLSRTDLGSTAAALGGTGAVSAPRRGASSSR
jgi:capsule synthesis protein PGA_cap